MDSTEIVRQYYDTAAQHEWERLDRHPVEFHVNKSYLHRYIAPGQSVLDVGGGPGRYSIHLSKMGCKVTLAELSQGNVDLAIRQAEANGVELHALRADARDLSAFDDASFDHVLLMGPLYHMPGEADRVLAVNEALRCLKPGGVLFASFISSYANFLYMMSREPQLLLDPNEQEYIQAFLNDRDFGGQAFTQVHFIRRADVIPFMERFSLKTLHFLGSEAMLTASERNLLTQPKDVIDAWRDLAVQICEREDIMSVSEHFLYVGRKEGA